MRDFRDARSGSFYAKRDQISGVSYYFYPSPVTVLPIAAFTLRGKSHDNQICPILE